MGLGYFVKLHEDYKKRKIQEEIRFVLSLQNLLALTKHQGTGRTSTK